MEYKNLFLTDEGDVTTITMNSQVNAIVPELLRELKDAIENARGSVVIITGLENFSTGADLQTMNNYDEHACIGYSKLGQRVLFAIEHSPKITIAAISGYALGGGLELALACDFRIAADTAKLGFPEARVGLVPCFGGSARLSKLVGKSRAKRLIMTGKSVTAEDAEWMGLVDDLSDNALPAARAFANDLLRVDSATLKRAKRLVDTGSAAEESKLFADAHTTQAKEKISKLLQKTSTENVTNQ